MHIRSAIFRRLASVTCLATCLVLGACGEEEKPAQPSGDSPWSELADPDAVGSPDGTEPSTRTPAELLVRLHQRVAAGHGHSDPSFQQDVEAVAAAMWAEDGERSEIEAARAHVQVANIAGEVSRWLAESENARAERTASDPTDVGLHDAFLAEAAKGPEAYRTWCAGAGKTLLEEHKQARRRKLFPPK